MIEPMGKVDSVVKGGGKEGLRGMWARARDLILLRAEIKVQYAHKCHKSCANL